MEFVSICPNLSCPQRDMCFNNGLQLYINCQLKKEYITNMLFRKKTYRD